jgi:MFS family permease
MEMKFGMARRLSFGLSREVWLVQVGIFLNMLGYGAVLPFEVIYLTDGRGFSLSLAGFIIGAIFVAAVVAAPFAGPLIDRVGARAATAGAGVALAAGYAGLAFAHTPAQAFAGATLAGIGNGVLNPGQSTLLAALASNEVRHRATAVSRVAANAGMGIGATLGGFIAAYGLNGFVTLYLLNAITYLVYVFVLVAVVRDSARPEPIVGGYRVVLRDRAFLHLALINVAMIAVGWGVFTWLAPPYANSVIGLSTQLIGLLLLTNTLAVVIAQVPIAKLAEGRRRVVMMAVAAFLFTGACLLVIAAGASTNAAFVLLAIACIAVGVGECFHTTVLTPLTAELAPEGLRGRYMALVGFSWWIGLAIAPIVGAPLLTFSSMVTFLGAAAVSVLAAVSALRLERRLPEASRLTPEPGRHSQAKGLLQQDITPSLPRGSARTL